MGARNTDLAKIHIAKKQLGWTEQEYRDQMFAVCRVRSSKDLDRHGRARFLKHLQSAGFKPSKPNGKTRGRPHNMSRSDTLKKIEALLAEAGRPWSYADQVAANVTKPKKDRITFCGPADLHKVLVALELDARRRLVKQIQDLLDYLHLSWADAARIAAHQAAFPSTRDLQKNSEAMSIVRRRLNAMAQEACEL